MSPLHAGKRIRARPFVMPTGAPHNCHPEITRRHIVIPTEVKLYFVIPTVAEGSASPSVCGETDTAKYHPPEWSASAPLFLDFSLESDDPVAGPAYLLSETRLTHELQPRTVLVHTAHPYLDSGERETSLR